MAFSLGPRSQSSGTRLVAFESIGSTNAEALARARAGEAGPLWLVTDQQTAGRGRRSRAWVSPRGNLAASILEIIDVTPAVAATLGFAAGLALDAALRQVSIEAALRTGGAADWSFALKWPNDVLAGREKLSGILLEAEAVASGLAIVVGMGTNVVSAPQGTPYPATSLASLGIQVGAEDLFHALSDAWAEFRGIWDEGHGFSEIRRLWLERAAGIGAPISIQAGEKSVEGIFETIDDTGCLILKTDGGERIPIAAGDVHFGTARSAGAA
jgi:BirA family biotin operon repressor/biotin-[acetyl-CoA-carboxylase] ligase